MSDDLVQTLHPRMLALLHDARDLADNALAENTLDTYESLWRDFCDFCEPLGVPALPAHPATVVSYLMHLAPAQKTNTLKGKLAAIRHFHVEARVDDPTKDPAVGKVMDGAQRKYGAPLERKAAVERDLLRNMVEVQPDTLTGLRNRAILLVGFACDLRRSEIVALLVPDVKFLEDRIVVLLRHSKTDQAREGYEINVPRIGADPVICPSANLRTWLNKANIKEGPLFRKVDRWGKVWETALTDQVVADVVKDSAAALDLDPREFGGHSLRRGLITTAARNQEETGSIRKVSRHKTEIMVDAYRADTEEAQMRVIGNALRPSDAKYSKVTLSTDNP